jgi:hypothetical protein
MVAKAENGNIHGLIRSRDYKPPFHLNPDGQGVVGRYRKLATQASGKRCTALARMRGTNTIMIAKAPDDAAAATDVESSLIAVQERKCNAAAAWEVTPSATNDTPQAEDRDRAGLEKEPKTSRGAEGNRDSASPRISRGWVPSLGGEGWSGSECDSSRE